MSVIRQASLPGYDRGDYIRESIDFLRQHEPPKVAGWYPWRSGKGQNMTMIQIHVFNGVCGFWDGNGVFITDLNRGEWAGPIPAPID